MATASGEEEEGEGQGGKEGKGEGQGGKGRKRKAAEVPLLAPIAYSGPLSRPFRLPKRLQADAAADPLLSLVCGQLQGRGGTGTGVGQGFAGLLEEVLSSAPAPAPASPALGAVIRRSSGGGGRAAPDSEWRRCGTGELVSLERRLYDVLGDLRSYKEGDVLEKGEEGVMNGGVEERGGRVSPMLARGRGRSNTPSPPLRRRSDRHPAVEEEDEIEEFEDEEEEGPGALAAAFESLPLSEIPQYVHYIRRAVCLESMHLKLQQHRYRSLADLRHDLYALLNNARSATEEEGDTWGDSSRLAGVFEQLVARSVNYSSAALPRLPGKEIKALPLPTSTSTSASTSTSTSNSTSAKRDTCACCKITYSVHNWPPAFQPSAHLPADGGGSPRSSGSSCGRHGSDIQWAVTQLRGCQSAAFQMPRGFKLNTQDSRDRREKKTAKLRRQWAEAVALQKVEGEGGVQDKGGKGGKSEIKAAKAQPQAQESDEEGQDGGAGDWSWLCGACVHTVGPQLLDADVLVWWHDDRRPYAGRVDAFDATSRCHRVLYEDGEWEFVNLAAEPAAFSLRGELQLPKRKKG
ncbi:hypothetical protein B484DRAFT_480317 [Ochromonadaceae sp. CCMP2298]|nr:hypothetical protein B484DRAFT_480317 [Ochromonadaceae sp. CCMP2298]